MVSRDRAIMLAIFAVMVVVIVGGVFLLTPRPKSYSLQKWLEGDYCADFCWQQIHAEMTSDELATHLENNGIDFIVTNPDKFFRWQESQPLVHEGQEELVDALYSLDAGDKVIRVRAGIETCITTIKRVLGAPDALQTVDGHYSMVYFDRVLKEGWTFNFRQETNHTLCRCCDACSQRR